MVFGVDLELASVLPEPELGLLHVADLEVLLVALHASEGRPVVEFWRQSGLPCSIIIWLLLTRSKNPWPENPPIDS